ncbi:MAG TPA: hypothetical protein VN736_11265 [Candidatus Limnocylindrales bacterium]|nr:hypothetical protein [Candidatus Limnocylindrales bacterium]
MFNRRAVQFCICSFLSVPFLTAATVPDAAKQKQRYYRPRGAGPVAPRQSGEPVVVNAASFLLGICPGALATVFGQDLTTVSGQVLANSNPLPTKLAGVEVDVNGVPAPIYSIAFANGQDQISFQVPYHTDTGPGAALVEIFDFGDLVGSTVVDSFIEDPGIFAYGSASFAVAVHNSDGTLVGPNNPAAAGEIIILYVTGLGPLTVDLPDGYGAPSNPLAFTVDPFRAIVDGEDCQVLFSGLGPGFVGLYQLNLKLPFDLRSGNLPIQITTQYANSQVATLPVF